MESMMARTKRIKKVQHSLGLTFLLLALISAYFLNILGSANLSYSWIFGLSIGFVLQRSRICFVSAFRDPFLFKLTNVTKAIIISLMITSSGYAIYQSLQISSGAQPTGLFVPLGWHIPIGAVIFGIGAAISGGCASGTLSRAGEGFQLQWVALVGFIIGSVHGGYDFDWWYQKFMKGPIIHLPSLLGWLPTLILQFSFFILQYYISHIVGKKLTKGE